MTVEDCPLDSELLGMRVGRLRSAGSTIRDIDAKLGEMQSSRFGLVYWLSGECFGPEELSSLSRPASFFGRNGVYSCSVTADVLKAPNPADIFSGVERLRGPETVADLTKLAEECASYSHLLKDPKIGKTRAYICFTRWLEDAVEEKNGRNIVAARQRTERRRKGGGEGKVAGFAVYTKQRRNFHVNLFAVSPQWRKRGLAEDLLLYLKKEAVRRGIPSISVVCQEENIAARGCYERGGFNLRSGYDIFHIWLK